MKQPLFSVIVPTFNRPHLLPRAIRSILSQTLSEYEIIVVDDGGHPGANEIITSFHDERIILVRHETNLGPGAARNTGIKAARGSLITFLDDDDEFFPGFLEKTNLAFRLGGKGTGFTWSGAIRVRDSCNGEVILMTLLWPARFTSREEGLAISSGISNSFGRCCC